MFLAVRQPAPHLLYPTPLLCNDWSTPSRRSTTMRMAQPVERRILDLCSPER